MPHARGRKKRVGQGGSDDRHGQLAKPGGIAITVDELDGDLGRLGEARQFEIA